jgi:hypothetical protein
VVLFPILKRKVIFLQRTSFFPASKTVGELGNV